MTPGQDIAGATCGHPGVPRRVDVVSAAVRHDRSGPLEHYEERLGKGGQSGGLLDAVRLHRGHILAGKPGEFTRVWRQDDRASQSAQEVDLTSQGVESVGVDQEGAVGLRDQESHEFADPVRLAKTRPNRHDAGRRDQAVEHRTGSTRSRSRRPRHTGEDRSYRRVRSSRRPAGLRPRSRLGPDRRRIGARRPRRARRLRPSHGRRPRPGPSRSVPCGCPGAGAADSGPDRPVPVP